MNPQRIAHQIEKLKKRLAELGPLHPGSISEQYNVCGTPGCQCKDPKKPRRHGPYYQLSLPGGARAARDSCGRRACPRCARRWPTTSGCGKLVNEWVELAIELEKAERAAAKQGHGD